MTDGFNFKLGRMRMNVDRKREFVNKHTEELLKMEAELRTMCPHEQKNIKIVEQTIEVNDFYNKNRLVHNYVCSVCGTILRTVTPT